ncbi:MAG: signal peptide peptidase SppA [Gammaproteobacteria bacterium]|nr:MAG: signal peptide peptidase SppA [Gammaproteobacteria bacterium]
MIHALASFLKFLWKLLDGVRRVVHLVLMLIVLVLVLAVLSTAPVTVPSSSALIISPSGALVDELSGTPLDRALEDATDGERETLVKDLEEAIDRARDDDRIEALVLSLDDMGAAGLAKLNRLAEAIGRFKDSGKRVEAAGGGFSQGQYFLAALADEIYLNPLGGLFLQGFGFYRTYLGEAVDKLSIDWHVFRSGEYKTMYDNLTRSEMSEVEKQESRVLIDQLWAGYREHIGAARSLDPAEIQRFADGYADRLRAADGDMANLARSEGLVDELLTHDEVELRLIDLVGEDSEHGSFTQIDFRDYLAATRLTERDAADGESKVAVIVASGSIVDGDQPPGTIGSESFSSLIREARQDEDIKAVVLRVDSPGGSHFASDVILSELALLREDGKPLVVSMGDIAASGGYLISLAGNEIWARAETVTGSIGVVAAMPAVDRALERLGIRVDGIGTTRYSGDFNSAGGLSADALEILQMSVDSSYARFLSQVADSRSMSISEVEQLAGGRVWTGRDAHRLGLVDRIGSLEQAIQSAATLAGLEDYGVEYLHKPISFGDALALNVIEQGAALGARFGFEFDSRALATRLAERYAPDLVGLLQLNDPKGIYYHCMCALR